MYIIDVNTAFGKRTEFDYDLSLETLLDALDDHQIAGALSCSLRGAHYDHRAGNDETIAAARAHPQILPVVTIDPREYLGWEEEMARCLEAGGRAFRSMPSLSAAC